MPCVSPPPYRENHNGSHNHNPNKNTKQKWSNLNCPVLFAGGGGTNTNKFFLLDIFRFNQIQSCVRNCSKSHVESLPVCQTIHFTPVTSVTCRVHPTSTNGRNGEELTPMVV
eukprot:TRINITY_DN67517_c2_g7_i1.p3 TRINITY_DN67517_c2_g7~~TRINITY_DN67517_c2_g7_i1.p3  ORF type:complete len:112 (+),score=8.20 TRINITY_DN67517_c2_g7_i1:140-475(+)